MMNYNGGKNTNYRTEMPFTDRAIMWGIRLAGNCIHHYEILSNFIFCVFKESYSLHGTFVMLDAHTHTVILIIPLKLVN